MYEFIDGMREISGFGGGYEQTCRNMIKAGCEWFDAHPDARPRFSQFDGIYGICNDENEDAKALTDAIISASGGDCTGAMHQACTNHILWIKKNGWEKYVSEMITEK